MKIINLSKKELLNLLFDPNRDFKGCYGILNVKGNHIYKINYSNLIRTYISHNDNCLDEEIDRLLYDENGIITDIYNSKNKLKEFKKLENTLSSDLINGVLSYRNVYVGTKMKYYKDYIKLDKAKNILNKSDFIKCLEKSLLLIKSLLENEIMPLDIKESNILINPKTLDVVLIDLDDNQTIYNCSDNSYYEEIKNNYYNMCKRLENI